MSMAPPAASGEAVSVASLVVAARAGDRAAFERLYELHVRMVHGLLLARVPREEVDDLQQEVFLHAWRRLNDLRTPEAFGGWLAQIARRRAVDHLRRPRRDVALTEEGTSVAAGLHIGGDRHRDAAQARAEAMDAAEGIDALDAIRRLPDAYRETLILRLVEGMTGPEIAARTGLTPGSVRVNLHRGMRRLRDILKRVDRHA